MQGFAQWWRWHPKDAGTLLSRKMSAPSLSQQQAIDVIVEAWGDSHYSEAVDEGLREYSSHPESKAERELFLGLQWRDVPESTLRVGCPFPDSLGKIPMKYFLPAYLVCALKNKAYWELEHRLVEMILKVPKKSGPLSAFKERFAMLSRAQKNAIAQFLRTIGAEYDGDSRTKRVSKK